MNLYCIFIMPILLYICGVFVLFMFNHLNVVYFMIEVGKLLSNLDSQVAADCILTVKVLLESCCFPLENHFGLASMARAYEFLSGCTLEYDFLRYKSFNYGS